ncbi:hypothetical protein BCR33DRAFT_785765 [Rhizoclosmatium globosum]|uniref:Uncharacterized protein n=1 Tax=Rhizoclosmatium globosum TaxID=329046 RepID=A0A1Y2C8Y0_9FUNG|nr:hypothetical protein BCR33DRAFT_785765 [Rhizoclosmatium globosum]|eukprot:ORY43396.1 hypothetical protein BCR33DRAFT_785765 [Rhizoclosmatium globosum]
MGKLTTPLKNTPAVAVDDSDYDSISFLFNSPNKRKLIGNRFHATRKGSDRKKYVHLADKVLEVLHKCVDPNKFKTKEQNHNANIAIVKAAGKSSKEIELSKMSETNQKPEKVKKVVKVVEEKKVVKKKAPAKTSQAVALAVEEEEEEELEEGEEESEEDE